MDVELKELLHEKAEEIRIDDRIPHRVLRRARRRRLASALVAGTIAAGLVGVGLAGIRAALPDRDPVFSTDPPVEGWRGIWPQDTREEAEAAQAAADAGDASATWQLEPITVIERFVFEELAWDGLFYEDGVNPVHATGPLREPLTVHIGDCNTVATEECFNEADLTLKRLLRPGQPTGIWFVTQLEEAPGDAATEADVRRFVEDFMASRNMGAGSSTQDIVSRQAMDQFEAGDNGLALYGPVDDPAFTGFDFVIEEITPFEGDAHEVLIRITERFDDRPGDIFVERLYAGPGENLRGDALQLVVLEAYRDGPPPGDPQMAAEDQVRDFVGAFMDSRMRGGGGPAEDFLTVEARMSYEAHEAVWHDDQPLYLYGNPHPQGEPSAAYAGYRIESAVPADVETCGWFDPAACQDAYEVVVVIEVEHLGDSPPGEVRETLIVAPSDGAAAEFAPWIITAAARGEEPLAP